jgi:hypothetical protein
MNLYRTSNAKLYDMHNEALTDYAVAVCGDPDYKAAEEALKRMKAIDAELKRRSL